MTEIDSFSATAADRPTMYFIGVSTTQSSIMKVFPAWTEVLGIERATIKGIDFPLGVDASAYREAVTFIKDDPLSLGALVTTHKIDLFAACEDMLDQIDPLAELTGEVSCLSKRGTTLVGHAKDPITAGRAIDGILNENYFANNNADLFCIGAGGAAIALTWHLLRDEAGNNKPHRLFVSDTNQARLNEIRSVHQEMGQTARCTYECVNGPTGNDSIVGQLGPSSVIVNATGMGKDTPGSPLTDAVRFPENAIAWDFNYRGNLEFLDQAKRQATDRHLTVVDGWTYFIHGWFAAIAEVFNLDAECTPEMVERLTASALKATGVTSR